MVDDVLLNKLATIERGVALAREKYDASPVPVPPTSPTRTLLY